MAQYVFFKDDGTVRAVGSKPYVPEGAYQMPDNFSKAMLANMMLVERPEPPNWAVNGNTYTLTDCPQGTTVKVADMIAGEWLRDSTTETEGETVSFQLPDPGTYQIELHYPFPYLSRKTDVVIT